MIFWIFVVMFVVGIVWSYKDSWSLAATFLFAVGLLVAGTMLVFIVLNNVNTEGQILQNEKMYESLKYQYETGMYENENGIGKKELMDQIEEWNTDLAFGKSAQKDFWIGIFLPNIYEEFDFIELEADNG